MKIKYLYKGRGYDFDLLLTNDDIMICYDYLRDEILLYNYKNY